MYYNTKRIICKYMFVFVQGRVTITFPRKCLNYGVCGIFVLVKIRFVRYLSAVLKIMSARLHTPCFFCKKLNAPSIASDTLACAVWNICEYTFKVVPLLQCPKAPETVVTSSPAEISEEAAK